VGGVASNLYTMQAQTLRQQIKSQRRQLTQQTLKQHSRQLMRLAVNYKPFRQSQRIAFYHAVAGEIDPVLLITEAIKSGKTPYLPILGNRASHGLWFTPFAKASKLRLNRYGIPEPKLKHCQRIKSWSLDMVFVPLIAFDQYGHRIGMGGGYYDRTFSFKRFRNYFKGPKLIGLAHDMQFRPHLNSNPWDIPLDAVITESRIYSFAPTI
jgi:5-formyltetrahydrofolate cyclo-ligase